MSTSEDASNSAAGHDLSSLFDFLPIGAYRSRPDGTMLRANPALVRLNGYASEAELLSDVRDIAREWYVDPARRDEFRALLERDGQVIAFVSEIYRYKTRDRLWISENAHLLRDASGNVLFYEGTVEEVTARVEAEAALQRERAAIARHRRACARVRVPAARGARWQAALQLRQRRRTAPAGDHAAATAAEQPADTQPAPSRGSPARRAGDRRGAASPAQRCRSSTAWYSPTAR